MTFEKLAAWCGFVAALWLTVFQLLLAGGAPLGALAWGGSQSGRLPVGKRAASLAAAVFGVGVASVFGQAAGIWRIWPGAVPVWLLGLVAVLFALSLAGNLASASRAERAHGAPLAAVLSLSAAILTFA